MINLSLKDLNPSSEELREINKLLPENRNIKGYKSMSEYELLSALKKSESLKESEKNFDDTKPKINFSTPKIKKIEKNLFKTKKYYDYDDIECKRIFSVKKYLICQLIKIIINQ